MLGPAPSLPHSSEFECNTTCVPTTLPLSWSWEDSGESDKSPPWSPDGALCRSLLWPAGRCLALLQVATLAAGSRPCGDARGAAGLTPPHLCRSTPTLQEGITLSPAARRGSSGFVASGHSPRPHRTNKCQTHSSTHQKPLASAQPCPSSGHSCKALWTQL